MVSKDNGAAMSRQLAVALLSGLLVITAGAFGFLSVQLYSLNSYVAELRAALPYITARTDENRRRIIVIDREVRSLTRNPGASRVEP